MSATERKIKEFISMLRKIGLGSWDCIPPSLTIKKLSLNFDIISECNIYMKVEFEFICKVSLLQFLKVSIYEVS